MERWVLIWRQLTMLKKNNMLLIKHLDKVGDLDVDVMSINCNRPQVIVHNGDDIYYCLEVESMPDYANLIPSLNKAYDNLVNNCDVQ